MVCKLRYFRSGLKIKNGQFLQQGNCGRHLLLAKMMFSQSRVVCVGIHDEEQTVIGGHC
jgi:hypothetical protein